MYPLEVLDLEPLRRLTGSLQHLVETHVWARVLVGMVLGILTACVVMKRLTPIVTEASDPVPMA